jgi:hypothetical protein
VLVGSFFEDILCDGQRREDVGPTDIEGQVCNHFARLCFRETVIHGPVQVIRHLGDLTCCNQRAHRYETSVARLKTRPKR